MRAVDCPCGEHLEAQTDSQLMEDMKNHASEEHPDEYSDAQLRMMVDTTAYDAGRNH